MRKSRVPGLKYPNGSKPKCKQCLEASLVGPDGQPINPKRGGDRVVRFLGGWACLDHYMVENTKTKEKQPLCELIQNRQHRRQLQRSARAHA